MGERDFSEYIGMSFSLKLADGVEEEIDISEDVSVTNFVITI